MNSLLLETLSLITWVLTMLEIVSTAPLDSQNRQSSTSDKKKKIPDSIFSILLDSACSERTVPPAVIASSCLRLSNHDGWPPKQMQSS